MSNEFIFRNSNCSAAFYSSENIANYCYWLSADLADYMESLGSDLTDQNLELAIERHSELVHMAHSAKSYWKECCSQYTYENYMLRYMNNLHLQARVSLEDTKPISYRFYKGDEDVKISRSLDQIRAEIKYINEGFAPFADTDTLDYLITLTVRDYELLLIYQLKSLLLERMNGEPDREYIHLFENFIRSSSKFSIEAKYLFTDRYREKLYTQFQHSGYLENIDFEDFLDRYLRVSASWEFVFQSMIDSCQMFINPHEIEFSEDKLDVHASAVKIMSDSATHFYQFLSSISSGPNIKLLDPLREKSIPHRKYESILTTWRSAYGI